MTAKASFCSSKDLPAKPPNNELKPTRRTET